MSATSSANPTVTKAATTGTYGGLVGLLVALVAGVTKTGFSLTDLAAALGSGGVSVGSLFTLAIHHNKALEHDAQLAVAEVPDLGKLRSDVDGMMPVAGDVNRILGEVAPGLDRKINTVAQKAASDIAALAAEVDAKAGVTPEQVRVVVHQQLAGLLSAVEASDRIPPGSPPTAGNAGAVPSAPTV